MVALVKKATGSGFLILGLLACVQSNLAQTTRIYSLAELVDSAKQHFPALQQKAFLASSAGAAVTEARHAFLPKVTIGDEALMASANSLPGAYLPLGIIPSVSGSINAQNNMTAASGNIAALYAEYELINFGLRTARNKSAEAYAALQQADFDRELYFIKWQIGKTYFELLKNKYQLAVDAENIKRYESIYSVITALTGSGINPGVDSSLAKAELSKTRISFNNRTAALAQLQQQLGYYTGMGGDIDIDSASHKIDPALSSGSLQTNDSVANANPLTAYYNRQEKVYQSTEQLVKKSYLPKIFLAAAGWGRGSSIDYRGEYKDVASGFGYQRFSYGFGVNVTYDLVNAIRKRDRLAVTHLQTVASSYDTKQQLLSLRTTALQADVAVKAAQKNLTELPTQLHAASDAFDQKVAQYKAGIINLVDLTNASFVLYTSQSDYVQTLNSWYVSNLDKAAATGNLDLFIQSIHQ